MKKTLSSIGKNLQLALQLDFFSDFLIPDQLQATPQKNLAPREDNDRTAKPPTPIPHGFVNTTYKRQILVQDFLLEYEFLRSKRRSIGFLITEHGLRVTAPRWVTIADVESAIQEKQNWILKKLSERRERVAQQAQLEVRWQDGAKFAFMGQPLCLRIDNSKTQSVTFDSASRELTICLPHDAGEQQLKDRVQAWLQQQAKQVFLERLPVFAEKLGVCYHSMALSAASTRWGSCTSEGKIRLNWRLIHFSPDVIDYVIAHELAHLKEMNHGPRFWATVQSVFPEFEQAKHSLRHHAAQHIPVF